jgi:hypothetical protein
MVWNASSRPKMPPLLVEALLPMFTREPICLKAVRNCGGKRRQSRPHVQLRCYRSLSIRYIQQIHASHCRSRAK